MLSPVFDHPDNPGPQKVYQFSRFVSASAAGLTEIRTVIDMPAPDRPGPSGASPGNLDETL